MRALVLGGNRYIGLHLVFELARQGHHVTVANSHEAALPEGAERIHVDRRVPGALAEALGPRRDDFDVVYDNTTYVPADVEPLVELFRGRVQHFVFTSSVAVYKRSFVQPITEGHARHDPSDPDPRKAYGVGKVQVEDLLASLHAEEGFPATTLRVGHTIGPKSPLPREHAFFARLEQRRPVLIPGDGFPFVQLVHVQDVAACMAAVAGQPRAVGHAYNVDGAEWTSVEGCMHLMAKVVGTRAEVVHVPLEVARRQHPPLVHWGEGIVGGMTVSIERARRDLGWEPAYGLEAAYADAWAWYQREGRDRYDLSAELERDERLLGSLG